MSNNQIIAALKARLESEKNKTADENWNTHSGKLVPAALGWIEKDLIKIGHQAATARLMSVIEKAVEMAESISSMDIRGYDVYDAADIMQEDAREFLSTLADASGELKKPGHYTLDAESFNKIIDDLDKEPSEQVKKAREKFLQLKKEAPDENK